MCGIAGYVSWHTPAERAVVERQLELLTHRGPDSAGAYVTGPAALGQTRLAVIDLVTGDPPITADDGKIGVAFNGEIYNFRELRHELQAQGHRFATGVDTEVIPHLSENRDAVEAARRLRGMFAYAVWDVHRERLTLARDHFGKKPLYYWYRNGVLVFGSEIKALLAHPAVPADLDDEAIPAYLGFGYVPEPRTFYKGIRTIPPGHVLTLLRGQPPLVEQYWAAPVAGVDGAEQLDIPFDVAAAAVRGRLGAAVERRLVADVPLGAFLSGGIDSSAVVALMAERSSRPVRTFTIGFAEGDGFDERAHARTVSQHLGTEHTELVVKPDAVELLEKLVWHYDEPFGDSTAIPTYLLSELTRTSVKVALSGDGGDELFAGYERFPAAWAVTKYTGLPRPLRAAARLLPRSSATAAASTRMGRLGRFLATADVGLPDAYRQWVSYADDELVARLTRGAARGDLRAYRQTWDATQGGHVLHRLLALNISTYLVGDLLPKADRMSMAHGLEVRSPFLDVDLAELALRLPPSALVRRGRLKAVLKASVADLLPSQILQRRKRGFGVPVDDWFRRDLAGYTKSVLAAPHARLRRHVDSRELNTILEGHAQGAVDHGELLWSLLTLETFLRRRGW